MSNPIYNEILLVLESPSSSKTAKGKAMRKATKIANDPGLADLVRTCTLDYKVKLDQIDQTIRPSIEARIKRKEQGVINCIKNL